MGLEECRTPRTDSRITLKSKRAKSKITFANPRQLTIDEYEIDGCVHKPGTPEPRCDFLLIEPSGTEHFVELKGKDIRRATEQLEDTIKRWGKTNDLPKFGYIVCSKSPTQLNSKYQEFKAKMKSDYNCIIERKENFPEISLPRS